MNLIKLDAIDSTNTYLKQLVTQTAPKDYTVVMTREQTGGRGQMGTKWISEPSRNLTFSLYKQINHLEPEQQFYISMVISLAVFDVLESFNIPNVKIKWPNDILSANKKVGGILIENILREGRMSAAIIGVGLNLNQLEFPGLINASSLKKITGVHYVREEVLYKIIDRFRFYVPWVAGKEFDKLRALYESRLFRKDKPSTFKDRDGKLIMGFIKGVDQDGKLRVLLEDEVMQSFELKELTLLY
ncbi:biotin--[acetyl-CoA-carboxylase] ligase [Robertkochia marina]|uniref:Biotin--[acetyl-CoA-carboxylase] ligase n=1 Tax=Robertkochia marina TaxID=1227945 RepID=A0A4S3LYK3_9FLAO|nr:biotin--[acetyl-CoA-carboxylase] ligase [Robertkochia marina]THD66375.1 biotin--[acetyl-CoA-carboxylase] ligase [Robertkochia marina]TRZ44055.1 biotin--[acetyl-CoA-carboxylase] ligase [Robertkochia marina]